MKFILCERGVSSDVPRPTIEAKSVAEAIRQTGFVSHGAYNCYVDGIEVANVHFLYDPTTDKEYDLEEVFSNEPCG